MSPKIQKPSSTLCHQHTHTRLAWFAGIYQNFIPSKRLRALFRVIHENLKKNKGATQNSFKIRKFYAVIP